MQYLKIAEAALDGDYGWLWEIAAICLIIVVFNFVIKRLLLALEGYFESHHKLWQGGFVKAIYQPMRYFVWYFAVSSNIKWRVLADQNVIEPAVILSLKLYVFRSPRVTPRQPQRRLYGFGATIAESDQIGARNEFLEFFGKLKLKLVLACI